MRGFSIIFIFVAFACSGCAVSNPPQASPKRIGGYTPSFTPIREGFRPAIPYYHAEVTFWSCQESSAAELQDIRDHFTYPLCEGTYYQHIAAIIINGSYESISTTFTIWLLDGRRLDSGYIFLNPDGSARSDFKDTDLGRKFYDHAIQLLKRAIPESKLREAKISTVA